jgi:lipoprotein NlpI
MTTTARLLLISIVGLVANGCEYENSSSQKPNTNSPAQLPASEKPTFDPASLHQAIADAYIANDLQQAAGLADKIDLTDSSTSVATSLLYIIGEAYFATGKPKQSVAAYDRLLKDRPNLKPQLWQRGLALYYAGDYAAGIDQLESHQSYNSQDVENSVWHLMMKAKIGSVAQARQAMIPISRDGRVPMKQIFDMFAGTGSPKSVLQACDYDESSSTGVIDPDSATYHGWLYIGLYHEMMGDPDAARKAMTQAEKFNPLTSGLMAHIAKAHLLIRKK